MTIFYTSDLHLSHEKVAATRGFADTVAHDMHVRTTWFKHVRPADEVWILGDLTGGGHLDYALAFISGLPGDKHLILGNHDQAHPMHHNGHRKLSRYLQVFRTVQLHGAHRIAGRTVLLSHFPYRGDSPGGGGVDRHVEWRLRDQGKPLLHGHTHSGLVRLNPDNVLHVGWDAWFRPVSQEEIADLLR